MRILVISNFYPPAHFGGYEQECARVVKHLQERHEVLVLSSIHARKQVPSDPCVLRILPHHRWRKRDSLLAPLRALRAAKATRRLLADFKPELIFIWNGAQLPQAALRIAETSGRPLAFRICEHWFGSIYRTDTFTRHLYPGDRGARWVWGGLMKLVNRHPALRIELTSAPPAALSWVSATLREQTPLPPTTRPVLNRVIYYGVEQEEHPRRRPDAEPTLAFIGRLTDTKAPDLPMRALPELASRHGLDARLLMAGPEDESYGDELRELARDLGVHERVEFLGALDRAGVDSVLERVHAIVVPSRWQEPAATVVVEAAAACVPVVAARSGGTPELLRENEQALFFDIDDVAGCAAAIARVFEDPEATERRVAAAKIRAADFTPAAYRSATDDFIAAAVLAVGSKREG